MPRFYPNVVTLAHDEAALAEQQSTVEEPAPWAWAWSLAHARSLPPTMKQRIRAEAHGKTPSCRHREPSDTESTDEPTACEEPAPTP